VTVLTQVFNMELTGEVAEEKEIEAIGGKTREATPTA